MRNIKHETQNNQINRIGAVLVETLSDHFECQRITGRTSHMLESASQGDILVFVTKAQAESVEQSLRGKFQCLVEEEGSLTRLHRTIRGRRGKVWLDHTWVEAYFAREVSKMGFKLKSVLAARERMAGEGMDR